jgi:16S rRNA (cytosine1402-N4)-methyltransferase
MEWLRPEHGGLFVDATLGLGGHSAAILEASDEARVIGIDRDTQALDRAERKLAPQYGPRFRAVRANFFEIARVITDATADEKLSGVLADFGVSSLQLDTPERGFSFRHEAPLDMRMDAAPDSREQTLAQYLDGVREEELARVIYEYGEERHSRRIARWIIEKREQGTPLRTTTELAALVARAVGDKGAKRHRGTEKGERIHPATRTFQALRIAINNELDGLAQFIETAVDLLQPGGRFVAISFHSLEDRVVKQTLRRLSGRCECDPRAPVCSCGARRAVEILTRRPVAATPEEVASNPRARSAKLRAAEKL